MPNGCCRYRSSSGRPATMSSANRRQSVRTCSWQPRLWGWADGSTADFSPSKILERMGCRIVAANGGATFGNPVGLDGVFEACCPPYHLTMDAAVDAVLAPPL